MLHNWNNNCRKYMKRAMKQAMPLIRNRPQKLDVDEVGLILTLYPLNCNCFASATFLISVANHRSQQVPELQLTYQQL